MLKFICILCAILRCAGVISAQSTNAQSALTSFWPPGPGNPIRPQRPPRELVSAISEISTARIQRSVEKLVSFGTRNTLSNQTHPTRGIGAARDWLASEFASYGGNLKVEIQSYIQSPRPRVPGDTVISNVLATLEGTEEPDRVYVVSGHYDSRASDVLDPEIDAPGANDDASGTAISLELARVFAKKRPRATIIFVAVAGEEQGLLGSNHLAEVLKAGGKDVQGMLNNDVVGSSTADDGARDPFNIRMFVQGIPPTETSAEITARVNVGGESDSPARQLGRFISEVASSDVTGINVRPIYRPDRYLRGGDHLSFLRNGFAAVRFTEPNEDFAHQHQDVRVEDGKQYGDLIEYCDFHFTARVARVNGVALWSLAQAPGIPKNVEFGSSGLTNNSTLTWTGGPGAKSYEIVWRPTDAPTWTHVIPVGNVESTTLDFSKDNVVFGVRAVGADGYKSPAGFPL